MLYLVLIWHTLPTRDTRPDCETTDQIRVPDTGASVKRGGGNTFLGKNSPYFARGFSLRGIGESPTACKGGVKRENAVFLAVKRSFTQACSGGKRSFPGGETQSHAGVLRGKTQFSWR